jgi:CubicO group peptidase (beta-lactamase class C family)
MSHTAAVSHRARRRACSIQSSTVREPAAAARRRLRRAIVFGCAVVLATGARPANAQDSLAALIARIEGAQPVPASATDSLTLTALMQRLNVPGVSVAVIKDFRIHWARSYGVADLETGRPVLPSTPFQAASISKPVTAMAALRLVQDGKLQLDGDINTVLRSWRIPVTDLNRTRPVTARALFSHTSGADDGFGFPGYDPGAPLPTMPQLLDGQAPSNVKQVLFARPPFQQYKYSGGGLSIMQLALTELTGKPFATLLQSTVLGPLGMSESSFEQPPSEAYAARVARAHSLQGRRPIAPYHIYPEQAAAGLWTTPSDLARFVIEVQLASLGGAGKVLKPALAREMVTPVAVGPFAVGLTVEKRGEGWYFSHGGANWGFRANIISHLRKGYGLVVMTNSDNGGQLIREIEQRVAAAYQWDSLDKPLRR